MFAETAFWGVTTIFSEYSKDSIGLKLNFSISGVSKHPDSQKDLNWVLSMISRWSYDNDSQGNVSKEWNPGWRINVLMQRRKLKRELAVMLIL